MGAQWLKWAKELQAIAQNGLTFAHDPFDIERYEAVRTIAAEIMAEGSGAVAGASYIAGLRQMDYNHHRLNRFSR